MKNVTKFTWAFDSLLAIGGALAGTLLIVVMLAVSVKVFFRYVLGEGLIGVDQISGTLLTWITFLGAAWVLKRNEHVTIDLLVSSLGSNAQRWFGVANSLICAFICLVITAYGSMEVLATWQDGVRVPAEIEMPRYLSLAVVPLGSLLLGIQFVKRARRFFHGERGNRAGVSITR